MTTVVDLNGVESQSPLTDDPTINKNLDGDLDGELNKVASNTLSLRNLSPKQLYLFLWSNMRSWGSFIDSSKMKLPKATIQWSKRFLRNIDYFRTNYVFLFAILLAYCILTSPFLLLLLGTTIGCCYLITLKNKETPFKILGYQFTLPQQYMGVGLIAFPFFWLAGITSTVFWVIGASLCLIGSHASLYAIEEIETDADNKQNDLFPASTQFVTFPPTETV